MWDTVFFRVDGESLRLLFSAAMGVLSHVTECPEHTILSRRVHGLHELE